MDYLSKTKCLLADTKPGTKIKVLLLESKEFRAEIQRDLGQLAKQAIPSGLITNDLFIQATLELPILVDVCFAVDHQQFLCHKVSIRITFRSTNVHNVFSSMDSMQVIKFCYRLPLLGEASTSELFFGITLEKLRALIYAKDP